MVTKILDNLYLGDMVDAITFKGEIICVMQEIPNAEPIDAYWIPIIRTKGKNPIDWDRLIGEQEVDVIALPHQLALVATQIDEESKTTKRPVLVHCMAGIERSPLAIVFYLHHFKNMTWDDAYDFIKEKRPEVANRLSWLNMDYDERMS